MTIVVAAGSLLAGVAEASLGDQATSGLQPHQPAVSTAATLPPLSSRWQHGRTPAAAWRAQAAAGPAMPIATHREWFLPPPTAE